MVICPGCPEKEAIKQVSVCVLLQEVIHAVIMGSISNDFEWHAVPVSRMFYAPFTSVHVLTVPWFYSYSHIFAVLEFTIYGTE